jgi:hypothetical protein
MAHFKPAFARNRHSSQDAESGRIRRTSIHGGRMPVFLGTGWLTHVEDADSSRRATRIGPPPFGTTPPRARILSPRLPCL